MLPDIRRDHAIAEQKPLFDPAAQHILYGPDGLDGERIILHSPFRQGSSLTRQKLAWRGRPFAVSSR